MSKPTHKPSHKPAHKPTTIEIRGKHQTAQYQFIDAKTFRMLTTNNQMDEEAFDTWVYYGDVEAATDPDAIQVVINGKTVAEGLEELFRLFTVTVHPVAYAKKPKKALFIRYESEKGVLNQLDIDGQFDSGKLAFHFYQTELPTGQVFQQLCAMYDGREFDFGSTTSVMRTEVVLDKDGKEHELVFANHDTHNETMQQTTQEA